MKTVAFVPIKLNSQRLKNKNILPLAGHPLCWHIFNALGQVDNISETYAYCSDEAIRDYIPANVHFLPRDTALDGDLVKGFEIYSAFTAAVDADIYVLAHTTSPFLQAQTIRAAVAKVADGSHDSAFSAERIQTFAWFDGKPINYNLTDVPRTQDIEPVFVETSGFFIFAKEVFKTHHRRIGFKPYIQQVDHMEAIDIDTQEDYEMALKLSSPSWE